VLSKMDLIKIERMDEALKVALIEPDAIKERGNDHIVHRVRKRGVGAKRN
jgi:hypothetical protein